MTQPLPNFGDAYETVEFLGSGGMGKVYKVREKATDKIFAIKALLPALAGDSDAVRQFEAEVDLTAGFTHPNLVFVRGYGRAPDGTPFMVMNFVDGMSLSKLLKNVRRLELGRALKIFLQISKALETAHASNIIHRDLKPGNILVSYEDDSEHVRVVDFGLGKLHEIKTESSQILKKKGDLTGTPAYMSPEQIARDKSVDSRSDIYSFGCVMYETLTGAPPFSADTPLALMIKHLREKPTFEAAPDSKSEIPRNSKLVILKCLEKNPDQRYQSVLMLQEDLLRLLSNQNPKFATGNANPIVGKKTAIALAAVAAVAAVPLAASYWIGNKSSEKPAAPTIVETLTNAEHAVTVPPVAPSEPNVRHIALASDLTNQSEHFFQSNRTDRCLAAATEATRLDPENSYAYQLCGRAYYKLEKFEDALVAFDKTIALDKDKTNSYSHGMRGRTYFELGNYPNAIRDLTTGIEHDPANADFIMDRASIYFQLKQFDRALADADKAIELRPKNASYHDSRGKIYMVLGRYQAAVEDFTVVVNAEPTPLNFTRRAEAYEKLGRMDLASKDRATAAKVVHHDME